MIPISVPDTPQLITTASVSGYPFSVSYPMQSLGSPHSTCQASLSIPSASGSPSASSNMSAPNGCGGIFNVSGSIGQSNTQNALYVVAPPDILVRELYGEAYLQPLYANDQVSELAVGNTIRQRFGDKQYFSTFNNYQDMVNGGFDGLKKCGSGCLSSVSHSTETTNAALIYAGVNTAAPDVADSKCFFSPTPSDWNIISGALRSPTTVFPSGLTKDPGCFHTPNRQIVYKSSVGKQFSLQNGSGSSLYL